MEQHIDDLLITDDRSRIDIDKVCQLLATTYWAGDRPRALIEKSIAHSLCISVFCQQAQVGFARVVTDHATFAWIADVVVDEAHRGRGIGKGIITFIQSHPDIPQSKQLLRTADAHGLYARFGFEQSECMMK